MRFLIDSNAAIMLLARSSLNLVERFLQTSKEDIGISAIVMHELFYGARRSQKVAFNLENLRLLANDFAILAFDHDDARVAGGIRGDLASKGTPIGPYDVLIAGQARARDLILVTNNRREFSRVTDLRLEDWTAAA